MMKKEGDDFVPGVDLKKDTIFGKDAKTKVESNGTFSNLGGVTVTPESYGYGDSWKTYAEEMDEKQGGAYGEGSHSQALSFKDIEGSDEKKRRNMQHYLWLSAGWLFPISGDFFVESQVMLKVKGTPGKRKVEDNETVYSQYLAGKIGTSAVEVTSDTKNHQTNAFGESNYGDLLVKVGTYKTPASAGSTSVIEKDVGYVDAAEGMYYKLGAATHEGAEISGKKVEGTNLGDVLKEKILGSKDASGTKLSQSIFMTRTLDFALKNNFEAALHANLGYAFNQYFAVYAKLGMSLDFYKLDYKKGAIQTGIDDYAFDNMNFKVGDGDVVIGNMYVSGKDGKAETGVLDGTGQKSSAGLKGSKDLDLFMKVSRDKRTGAKSDWDKEG